MSPLLALVLLALAADVLEPGGSVSGEVVEGSPSVSTPTLERVRSRVLLNGEAFRFDAPAGKWTLELRSAHFDAYLVVEDARGEVVAEDDDGLGASDARVLLEVPGGGAAYTVWACSQRLVRGRFELRAIQGDAPIVAPEEQVDAATFVAELYAEHGVGAPEAVARIWERASGHAARREYLEAVELNELALAPLDPEEPQHRIGLWRLQQSLMIPLHRLGRGAEAIDRGLAILPLLDELPEVEDHAIIPFNVAYYMWDEGRYEEALDVMVRWADVAPRVLPEGSLNLARGRDLYVSLLRVNGVWDEAWRLSPVIDRATPWTPGEVIEGEITLDERLQVTPVVTRDYSRSRARYEPRPFTVVETGTYAIDLSSFAFDAYLVVRDARGSIVAEDDDGRGRFNSRVVVELVAGEPYVAEPTALHGRVGRYRLELIAGPPVQLSSGERRDLALAEAEACRRMADEWTGEPSMELGRILAQGAYVYGTLGRYAEAVELEERRVQLFERMAPGSPAHDAARRSLVSALNASGRAPDTIPILEESIREGEARGADFGGLADLYRQLVRAWSGRGDHERATEILARCRDALASTRGTDSAEYVETYVEEAGLLAGQKRYAEACAATLTYLDWHEARGARHDPVRYGAIASAHHRLGDWQCWTGELDEARTHLEEAIHFGTRAWGEGSGAVASSRTILSWVLNRLGDFDAAVATWRRANAALDGVEGGFRLRENLGTGAEVLLAAGRTERAFELALRVFDLGTSEMARQIATLPEPLRLRQGANWGWNRGLLLGMGPELGGREAEIYERLVVHESLVARGLVESRIRARDAEDPDTRAAIRELRGLQSELANAFHAGDAELVRKLREERVLVEDRLARSRASSPEVPRVTVEQLSGALPEGAVLVDFLVSPHVEPVRVEDDLVVAPEWWRRKQVTAWVLRAGEAEVRRVDLGPAEQLQALLDRRRPPRRELLASRGLGAPRGAAGEDVLLELRRRLWDPIAPHVDDASPVFLSTYDFLATVPFEALPLDDGTFLLEHHALVHVPEPTDLIGLRPPTGGIGSELLLVGEVDYAAGARPGAGEWPRLPGTAREVARLAELVRASGGEVTTLTASDATEGAFVLALAEHASIHVASHGFFLDDEGAATSDVAGLLPGLLSGLVFAGANASGATGAEDGLLTAEELTWLDLMGCQLVTLSACETGLGRANGGEGLIGLRRAFHQAGARTVVASLWAVEDDATATLMESFYRYLWVDGLPRGEALRTAQLDLLRAGRERGDPRPEAWGAFALSGEWR